MSRKLFLTIVILIFFLQVKAQKRIVHFIKDSVYREQLEKDFEKQKKLVSESSDEIHKVFSGNLTLEEKEGLEFLYAYMPLSDLADYKGSFFLEQVRMSLLARETFKWGQTIPDDVFRHFVLPYRVNNENLDSSRTVFFYELKDRIINLSMHDAALEVNHWCHEKVSYRSTDSRTSAPLSTVKTAYGRCGEESTFTVTALRAVGIPARQVYTPRWAHCDDNHAWVEVWIDGNWHFLGACEPEPDLDIAWFAGPVLRAMLCNTTVYGNYISQDEILKSSEIYTQINLIENYAPSKKLFVKAVDKDSIPLEDANIEFQLYNYAEFYPLARKNTDKNGLAYLTTGLGDLLIWASWGNKFGFQKVTVEKTDMAIIIIDRTAPESDSINFTLVPPIQRQPKIPDEKGKKENEKRLQNEDKIRNDYESTFIDSLSACRLADELKLNRDSVYLYLKQSRGNWKELSEFIKTGSSLNKVYMYQILANISQKDLRDTPSTILLEHLKNSDSKFVTDQKIPLDIFYKYVLTPRISGELLSEYKLFFKEKFGTNVINKTRQDPTLLVKYVSENIGINSAANYSRNPLTPVGTHRLKTSDPASRDIYFVAIARSFGIPAQIDPATKLPEYFYNNQWTEVYFETNNNITLPKTELIIDVDTSAINFKPIYYSHFTIARYAEGVYRSLDYEESTVFSRFPASLMLDTGKYMIVTGIRLKDGSVNTKLVFFKLTEGTKKTIQLHFIQKEEMPESFGTISLNYSFKKIENKKTESLSSFTNGKGVIIGWLDPDREPTKHTMIDFKLLHEDFEKWNGGIIFFLPKNKKAAAVNLKNFEGLPSQCIFGVDKNNILNIAEKNLKHKFNKTYPVFLVITKEGNILYYSSGYKIGRGEEIVKTLKFLK